MLSRPLPYPLVSHRPLRAVLIAILTSVTTAVLGFLSTPGAVNLPGAAVRLGGDTLIVAGLSSIALLGTIVMTLARLTAASASPGQAALPVALAVAMLMPGTGATAYLAPIAAALWLWLVEGHPPPRRPRAANDNRRSSSPGMVFAEGQATNASGRPRL